MAEKKNKKKKSLKLDEALRLWKEEIQRECRNVPVERIKARVHEMLAEEKTPYQAGPIDEDGGDADLNAPEKGK